MKPVKFCIGERVIVSHPKADLPVGTVVKLPTLTDPYYEVQHDSADSNLCQWWSDDFMQSLSLSRP